MKNNELDLLKEEIKALKNEKNTKISNFSTINNNNNKNINNNIQNNTIHIHSYGKEDFSYIDEQTLLLAHRAPFISIPLLVTKMFFNDEHPENQNVKWKNKKNKKINYMQRLENGENGPEWVNRDKNEVIRDLNDRAYNTIDYGVQHKDHRKQRVPEEPLRVFCAKVRLSGQSDGKTTRQGDGETHTEQENDKIK
jgi:hypothetical protein